MNIRTLTQRASLMLSMVVLTQSMAACGGSGTPDTSKLPPIDESRGGSSAVVGQPVHRGMSNGQKAALLVGAAAIYYMYKKNQAAHASGNTSEPQYYLSKNGRVYYREAGGRVHWVDAPKEGISVPRTEAQQYSQFEGYDGQPGRSLAGLGTD